MSSEQDCVATKHMWCSDSLALFPPRYSSFVLKVLILHQENSTSLQQSSPPLNDDTKILTESDTETFLTIPNFLKPKPRLFSETKFFWNRNQDSFSEIKFFWNQNQDFSSDTKFSETETNTFFPIPNFSKPKLNSSKIWQKSQDQDQNRDFSTFTNFAIFGQIHN